jgi:hypothetical protein
MAYHNHHLEMQENVDKVISKKILQIYKPQIE